MDFLNKIIHDDCLNVMQYIPDKFIDIVITSPPYNADFYGFKNTNKYNGNNDSLSIDFYKKLIFNVIDLLLMKTKYYIFFNIQKNYGNQKIVYEIIAKYIDYIKDIFIWGKNNFRPCLLRMNEGEKFAVANGYEFIFVLSKSDNKNRASYKRNNINSCISNLLIKNSNTNNKYSKIHKAVFPLWMPLFFINNFSKENDIICDPFSGIGTTAIACYETNRNFICIEKEKKYVEIARKRLQQKKECYSLLENYE